MLRVKKLKGNLAVIPLPLPLARRIMDQLGWNEFEKLGFGWELAEKSYIFRFWRDKSGKAKFQRWKEAYEIFITDFFLEEELVIKKIYKDSSPWLDPMLVVVCHEANE